MNHGHGKCADTREMPYRYFNLIPRPITTLSAYKLFPGTGHNKSKGGPQSEQTERKKYVCFVNYTFRRPLFYTCEAWDASFMLPPRVITLLVLSISNTTTFLFYSDSSWYIRSFCQTACRRWDDHFKNTPSPYLETFSHPEMCQSNWKITCVLEIYSSFSLPVLVTGKVKIILIC